MASAVRNNRELNDNDNAFSKNALSSLVKLPPQRQLYTIFKHVNSLPDVSFEKSRGGAAVFSSMGEKFLSLRMYHASAVMNFICNTESFHDPHGVTRLSRIEGFERELFFEDCPDPVMIDYFIKVSFREAGLRTTNDKGILFDPVEEYSQLFAQAWTDGVLSREERLSLKSFADAAWFIEKDRAQLEYKRQLDRLIHTTVLREFPMLDPEEDTGSRAYFISNTGRPAMMIHYDDGLQMSLISDEDIRHHILASFPEAREDESSPGWLRFSILDINHINPLMNLVFLAIYRAFNGNRPLPEELRWNS